MPLPPVNPSPSFEISDALLIDQRLYALAAEPLAVYFAMTGTTSPFAGALSGKDRGYQATWEIRDGRLYLISIQGTLAGGRAGSLADLFPEFRRRVFAHWFSGRLQAVSPRRAIGTVVLRGIEVAAPPGPLEFDVECGIVLASNPADRADRASNPAADPIADPAAGPAAAGGSPAARLDAASTEAAA